MDIDKLNQFVLGLVGIGIMDCVSDKRSNNTEVRDKERDAKDSSPN